jgi:hypothetical protein
VAATQMNTNQKGTDMDRAEKFQNIIDHLEAENAELRRQLDQARNIAALLESESFGGADCG